uniref:Uncharacterized protein n=1 Tax=Thermus thermophilus (strain ATCC 27634 / DSM 579 / HB8) TaxID=300852 RepID=G9MB67_THET8|nr:hypothetical protein [Thermus thermophilus HB8]
MRTSRRPCPLPRMAGKRWGTGSGGFLIHPCATSKLALTQNLHLCTLGIVMLGGPLERGRRFPV